MRAIRINNDRIVSLSGSVQLKENEIENRRKMASGLRVEIFDLINHSTFVLPTDRELLIARLNVSGNLYTPKYAFAVENLQALKHVFGKEDSDWEDIFVKFIDRAYEQDDSASLNGWVNMLKKVGLLKYVAMTEEKMEEVSSKLNIVADMDRDFLVKSKRLFSQPSRHPREVLTEMKLTPMIAGEMASVLGSKYDMFRMMDQEHFKEDEVKLSLHNAILSLLQNRGFPGVGLEGQPLLVSAGNGPEAKAWTVGALEKFLDKLSGEVVPVLPATRKGPAPPPVSSLEWLLSRLLGLRVTLGAEIMTDSIAKSLSVKDLGKNHGKIIARWIAGSLLVKGDYHKALLSRSRLAESRAQNEWRLDPWQKQFLEMSASGLSFIAVTPTSAGKTFIAMSSIDLLLNKNETRTILVYVAPSYDLALQTYNNVKKTFDRRVISLVTARTSDIQPNTEIWIGTPIEMWVYFKASNISYHVGYFDEVHTISINFGDDRLRSEALGNLMGLCRRQFIGLSATIRDDDIPRLQEYISDQCGLKMSNAIVHRERPIPQESSTWLGNRWVPGAAPEFVPVNPPNTFALLRRLMDHDRIPALIFDNSAELCWNNYEAYVNWLSMMEANDYARWHRIGDSSSTEFERFNNSVEDVFNRMAGDRRVEAVKTTTAFVRPRILLAEKYISEIQHAILHDLSDAYDGSRRPLSEKDYQRLFAMGMKTQYVNGVERELLSGDLVAVEVSDLLSQLDVLRSAKNSTNDMAGIGSICSGMGPYYRAGVESEAVEEIKSMFEIRLGETESEMKLRMAQYSRMLQFCEAERIRESEVRPLFKLIIKGIEFGVGIIVPTLPFAVYFSMLKLMTRKAIPLIFASLDMSMGINYPIRTVCIRSNEPVEMNVCEYLQAAGRSGRRRLDTVGYVVSWNIANALRATQNDLPHIDLPILDEFSGSRIRDHLKIAEEIDVNRIYSLGGDLTNTVLFEAIAATGYSRAVKKQRAGVAADFGDGELLEGDLPQVDEDGEDLEGTAKRTTSKKTAVKAEISDKDMVVGSAVVGCVSPLAVAMGIPLEDLLIITKRIQAITFGSTGEDIAVDAYLWAQKIGFVKCALQELHTKLHRCSNIEWFQYIEAVYELIHRVQLRQLRIRA
jgi:hypothetical protein